MADFLLHALLAGLALALVAGPLGSFVVWRRMAYFGETLSHAALLGVALGLWLAISPTLTVIAGCLLLAVALLALQGRQALATDTLLGILAPTTLALGLVTMSLLEVRVDLLPTCSETCWPSVVSSSTGCWAAARWSCCCWCPCGDRCWPSPCTRSWRGSRVCRWLVCVWR